MHVFYLSLGLIVCSIAATNGRSTEFLNFDKIVFPDSPSNECIVEKIPENGWTELNLSIYRGGKENRRVELHERIPSWSMVKYKCHESYHNFGAAENMCFENKWRREVPDCERFCQLNQAVPENEINKVTCSRNAIEIPCTERIRIGTNLIAMNERNEPVKKVCSNLAEWDLLSNLI